MYHLEEGRQYTIKELLRRGFKIMSKKDPVPSAVKPILNKLPINKHVIGDRDRLFYTAKNVGRHSITGASLLLVLKKQCTNKRMTKHTHTQTH